MAHHKQDTHPFSHGSDKNSEFSTQRHASAISAEQREHMIAEAAYFLAEQRDFQGGDPLEDWFQAQMEIDSKVQLATH